MCSSDLVLYAVVAALFIAPAIFGGTTAHPSGWPRRLLASRVLAWLGLVSYGIFLYHGPLVLWLSEQEADQWLPGSGYLSLAAIAVAMGIASAAASYYLVERPMLRLKDRAPKGSSSVNRRSAARASAGV